MFGSEELVGRYNPSTSNDKIINLINKYQDEQLERLRMSGQQKIAATRDTMQNLAKIPDKMAEAYDEGLAQNRANRQLQIAEEQAAREREVHPYDLEAKRNILARNKLGLTEEEKSAQDAQRQRDYLQGQVDVPGVGKMTREQYNFYLQQKGQETGLKAQEQSIAASKAGMGASAMSQKLTQEQITDLQRTRQLDDISSQYIAAMSSGDQKKVQQLDAQYANVNPAVVDRAKLAAQQKIMDRTTAANMVWSQSPEGARTQSKLQAIQNKAETVSQLADYVREYKNAGLGTAKQDAAKQNIIALLNRPELGEQGQILAQDFASGVSGLRVTPASITTSTERLSNGLSLLAKTSQSEISQIEQQNAHVKVPAFLNTLQSTKTALDQALMKKTDAPKPPIFMNQNGQMQQVGAPRFDQTQMNNAFNPTGAPLPPSRFRSIQNRGSTP